MPSTAFAAADFKVFEVTGFPQRMSAIRTRIRPKLETLGQRLLPEVSRAIGAEAFAHVAKHARRTVNPPDDTWVAFAPDKRGYKKHCHFKVAVSRNAVRFLFEVGPEHDDKKRWAAAWKKNAPKLGPVLNGMKGLAYFKNEHDEAPAYQLADLSLDELAALGDETLRRRDGQFVVGRVVPCAEAARWTEAQYRTAAVATVRALSPPVPLAVTASGVIFDMDGVLVDSGEHHRAAWRALLAELGADTTSPESWRLTIGRPAHEAVALLLGRAVAPDEAMQLADRKRDFYRHFARRGAVAVPGVAGFLASVVARGIACAVATSASRHDARHVLATLGLAQHFGAVVTAEDVTRGKPDPEVYVRAADAIGIPPHACLVFEDAVVGVQAARAAGMRVIGVTTAHTGNELSAAGAERAIADFEGLAWPI